MSNSFAGKTYALFENPGTGKIVSELENAGAQVIKFPVIEADEMILNEDSKEILNNLRKFDWVIFPDVLTVDFFLQILEENAIDSFELDEMRVCACGEIVSDRLRFVQLHADVIPLTIRTEDVLTALENYIAADEFMNLKFLLPKEISFQNDLKNVLLKMKGEVSELPVYQIKFPKGYEISKLKALLKGGAIDEFIFTAPTDFIWLSFIFKGEPLDRLLTEVKVSAVDNLIFQTAREHNLKRAGLFRPGKIDTVDE